MGYANKGAARGCVGSGVRSVSWLRRGVARGAASPPSVTDDVAADPLAADTPRPRRAAPGSGGEAEAETAQPTGAGEPEKADGEDTETAESLSFADLLNQLEDMARHSKFSRGKV